MIEALNVLPAMTWLRAVPCAVTAALLVAVPSDVIDTPLFGRAVEVWPIDYVTLAIAAGIGEAGEPAPSGAGSFPFLLSGAIGLLLWTLRYRLQTYLAEVCSVLVERRSVPVDQWASERRAIGGEVGGGEADVNQM